MVSYVGGKLSKANEEYVAWVYVCVSMERCLLWG